MLLFYFNAFCRMRVKVMKMGKKKEKKIKIKIIKKSREPFQQVKIFEMTKLKRER